MKMRILTVLSLSSKGQFIGAIVAFAGFAPYAIRKLKPQFNDGLESESAEIKWFEAAALKASFPDFVPENRLPVAMVGAILLPVRSTR